MINLCNAQKEYCQLLSKLHMVIKYLYQVFNKCLWCSNIFLDKKFEGSNIFFVKKALKLVKIIVMIMCLHHFLTCNSPSMSILAAFMLGKFPTSFCNGVFKIKKAVCIKKCSFSMCTL